MAMRPVLLFLALVVVPASGIELWLRLALWQHASYSNSAAIDIQLAQWRAEAPFDIVFVGDSEVRWGIDPNAVEAGLVDAGGPRRTVFNHGFDGFGMSWWSVLLPRLFNGSAAYPAPHVIALGVQLMERHPYWESPAAVRRDGGCGALQRPVVESGLGIDLALTRACRDGDPLDELAVRLARPLWLTRYRSAVKSLILPPPPSAYLPFNSAKSGAGHRGYEPHRPIAADVAAYEGEFARWLKQFEGNASARAPLPPEYWNEMVASGGFFDRLVAEVRRIGAEPVLFALPTNPVAIDALNRRGDVIRNSALLRAWARDRHETYVDLGLLDDVDRHEYFSDMRHLSDAGAVDYSRRLGRALAAMPGFRRAIAAPAP